MIRSRLIYTLLGIAITWIAASSVQGQTTFEYWPNVTYDASVPTIESVLGYDAGERITSHAGLMSYLEALERAAPDRVTLVEYAQSWEGRKLVYAFVGSRENIGRLDAISEEMQQLADPRITAQNAANELIGSLPAIVCLSYGVHGNEISSPDAALLTAYHLLAATEDPVVGKIMENTIVMIDPTQNPDGRDRFVHNFEIAEGLLPDANPLAAEHNEPWPGGRTNHYYFDLNRDWLALTQPETRGRVRVLQEYYPLVFVDLHEMGSNSSYYFAPEAVPYNPHLAEDQRASLELFGRNNAKWFDEYGFSYFTREVFDAFYPGYGASWPSYYGSVAMTYEQASARGLVVNRTDGTTMHFRDSVRHHFVASISTAETAADNRSKLLTDFYNYRKSAIREGQTESIKAYILPRTGNVSAVDKLAAILHLQGVEVQQARAGFRAAGQQFETGSYLVTLAQPSKRLIRTLLDQDVPMDDAFLKEQERRRSINLGDQIYDVTAWSLPLMWNIASIPSSEVPRGDFATVRPPIIPQGSVTGGNATVAYLVPWGTQSAGRLLAATLHAGIRVHSTDKQFTQNGRIYPSGTLIYKVKENSVSMHARLASLAANTGAEVHATNTGWVDDGPNFGSGNVVHMRRPKVAIAWDRPTSSNSAGATRFVLERQFGYPVTPIRTRQLGSADLSGYHVVILPGGGFSGGGYASVLGESGVKNLKEWVQRGGTLIGISTSTVAFLAAEKTGLLDVSRENAAIDEDDKKDEEEPTDGRIDGSLLKNEADYQKAIRAATESPDAVAGVLAQARLDPDHWLAAGIDKTVNALVSGSTIFSPVTIDKGRNPAVYAAPEELLQSGYMWEESRLQLAHKPLVIIQSHGRGNTIGFTADPNYRAYMDGLNILFINAVFRGAAHANPQVTGE
jgi:hypothetical protein